MRVINKYNKFSFSKINTYQNCPQKYKITYIDGIRKSHESIEAFMGKRVHEVLDWIYKERHNIGSFFPVDVLLKKYNDLWVEKWHENIYLANIPRKYKLKKKSKDQVYQNGLKCLVNYYNRYKPNFNNNIIETEIKCETTIAEYKFFGVIDRLDRNREGIYEIYDYKTGAKPITKYNASNDLQLLIYLLSIQKKYEDCKEIILNWYFLFPNEIVSIRHSKEKIIELKSKILKIIFDIKNDKKYYSKESLLCEWCYLWEECEVKSISNPAIKLI